MLMDKGTDHCPYDTVLDDRSYHRHRTRVLVAFVRRAIVTVKVSVTTIIFLAPMSAILCWKLCV